MSVPLSSSFRPTRRLSFLQASAESDIKISTLSAVLKARSSSQLRGMRSSMATCNDFAVVRLMTAGEKISWCSSDSWISVPLIKNTLDVPRKALVVLWRRFPFLKGMIRSLPCCFSFISDSSKHISTITSSGCADGNRDRRLARWCSKNECATAPLT